jgi:hypothetical protein
MTTPIESTKYNAKGQYAPQLRPLNVKDEKTTPEKSKYYKPGETPFTARRERRTRKMEVSRNNQD